MAFTLLHLSDLHFDSAETEEVKQARRILALGGLIRRLSELFEAEPELRPSAICISGDVAYRGARAEYDAAEVWIRQLLQATGLTAEKLIVAAGNHDIDRTIATKVARPKDHSEADQLLGVPADPTLIAAFGEFEAFCERIGVPRLRLGSKESYLTGSRTIDGVRFLVLNSAWLARDNDDAGRLWLGHPQLLVLEAREQMCPFDRDFSTVEIAVFHHPQEYLAEEERNAFQNRPATFRHVAARVDLILTGHTHVQDVREPDQIGMRAYHFSGGATFVNNEYHNHVRLFRIDVEKRTVEVVALRYDPLNQRWDVRSERNRYDLVTRKQVERLRMGVREAPTVEDNTASVQLSDPEAVWHQLVDEARDLLRAGKSAAARTILLSLRSKPEAAGFSDKLRFRIATNLGGAAIELDDFRTAVVELQNATTLERTAESVSNAALALLGAGDIDAALRTAKDAVELDHSSDAATFVHLKALSAAGEHGEIDRIASAIDTSHTSFAVALALADVYLGREQYALGEMWARTAVAMQPEHPFANMLLAENIVADVNASDDRDPSTLTDKVTQRLADAETAVLAALKVFGSDDHSSRLNVALNVRAGIAALRGSFEQCIEYTDQVLARDPQNEIALQNRGLALHQLGRHEEAVGILTSIRNSAIEALVALPVADAYLKLDQPQKARDVLLPHFHPERADVRQLQAAEVLLDSATRRNALSELDELERVIEEHWPDNPVASAVIASKEFAVGRRQKAISRVQAALKHATGGDRATLFLHLGRMYHDAGEYASAVRCFESAAGTVTAETASVDRYVHALFRLGRLDRALDVAREIRGWRQAAGKVTEIEADILTQQGDLPAAAVLFEHLASADPTEVAHRTRLAMLYARCGRRDEARALVEQVSLDSIKDESERLFEIARLRLLLEMPGVIRFAYFGRRVDFHRADAHSEYIRLFNAHDVRDEPDLAADSVAEGTTCYLKNNGSERVVSVLPESENLRSTNELHPSSALAARLLGRRAGEKVVIKQTALEEQIVVIREVISNYVWAYRESMENFTTWFPDDAAMQMGGDDPASMDRLARHFQKQNEAFAQIVTAYDQRDISLPLFAEYASMRSADAWRRVWNDEAVAIRVRAAAASATLAGQDVIVVELTSLLTLHFLGVLQHLSSRFQVVVPQLTLDELNEEILQIAIQDLSAVKIANAGDDPNRESALDEARHRRASYIALRDFVETKTERRVSTSLLTMPPDLIAKRERLLGRSGLHSLLVAIDYNLPVIIDDSIVRELAINEKATAASSLEVLEELRRSHVLTDEEHTHALETLRSVRYDAVSE